MWVVGVGAGPIAIAFYKKHRRTHMHLITSMCPSVLYMSASIASISIVHVCVHRVPAAPCECRMLCLSPGGILCEAFGRNGNLRAPRGEGGRQCKPFFAVPPVFPRWSGNAGGKAKNGLQRRRPSQSPWGRSKWTRGLPTGFQHNANRHSTHAMAHPANDWGGIANLLPFPRWA